MSSIDAATTDAADAAQVMPVADLPGLVSDYPMTDQQIEHYREHGHIALRAVCSGAEIAAYRPVIEAAADRYNSETRPLEQRDTYGKAFLQIMNLWTKDAAVRRFTLARRFAKIAAALLGVSGVRLYHDQALFKEPGGGPTPWHQDQYYWPLDTDKTVTMWMPLVEISAAVGSLRFASGSHQSGYLGELAISDQSDAYFEHLIAARGFARASYGAMAAGDATFHAGWTLHSAPNNPTAMLRSVMTVIYFADGARVSEPDNPNRQADLATWLPGLKPGDLAASEINVPLYP